MKIVIKKSDGAVGGYVGVIIFCWAIYSFIFRTYMNSIILYAMLMLACVYLTLTIKHGILYFKEFISNKGIAIMSALFLMSSVFINTTHLMACVRQLLFIVMAILFGYLTCRASSEKQFFAFCRGFQIVLVVASVLGILEWFTGENLFVDFFTGVENYKGMGSSGRIASCFIHSIPFGHIMLYAICFSLYLPSAPVVKAAMVSIFAFSTFTTGSRSAWLVLAFVCAVYIFLNFSTTVKKRTPLIIYIAFVGLIIFLYTDVGLELINWMGSRLGSEMAMFSTDVRSRVYLYFFANFFNSDLELLLFGHGFNALAEVITTSVYQSVAVDNTLLQIMYDYGLIAGILTVLLILYWLKCLITSRQSNKSLQLVLVLLITNTLMSMFYDSFGWKNVSFLSFVFIGCWMALEQLKPKSME